MASYSTGQEVLDIGFSQSPNFHIKATHLVGLDICDSHVPRNYHSVYKGDALNLPAPFEPESFDTIMAGEILEHVENPIHLLRQIHRTLKPQGRLVLSTPNPLSPPEVFCNIFLNKSILYTEEHITLYPQRWLIRLLENAGFRQCQLKSGGIQFPFVGSGPLPSFGLVPFPRAFCYQTIAIAEKAPDAL